MRPLDWAAAFTVILIWALNFVVGKIGVGELPPLLLMALRFTLVAALLVRFLRPLGEKWKIVAALSVVFGLGHFGLLFSGLRGVDAGAAAIAIQLAIPFTSALAWIFFGERMGVLQMAGVVVAFAGVYLLAGEPAAIGSVAHLAMVVAGAFAWAVANMLIKRLGGINVFQLNAWVAVLATPQLLAASLIFERGQLAALSAAGWGGWFAVVYMAVGASIVAYGLWYHLLARYELNRVVPLTLLSPVLAVFLAVLILGEPMTVRIVAGGLITIAGVAMIQFLGPGLRRRMVRP